MAVNEDQSADFVQTRNEGQPTTAVGAGMPQPDQGTYRPRHRRRITLTLQKTRDGYILRAPGGAILNVPACNDWVRETGFHLEDGYEQPLDILMRADGEPQPSPGLAEPDVPPPQPQAINPTDTPLRDYATRIVGRDEMRRLIDEEDPRARTMRERVDRIRQDQVMQASFPRGPDLLSVPMPQSSIHEWTEDQLRPELSIDELRHQGDETARDVEISAMPAPMQEAVRQQISINVELRRRLDRMMDFIERGQDRDEWLMTRVCGLLEESRGMHQHNQDRSVTFQRHAGRLDELERRADVHIQALNSQRGEIFDRIDRLAHVVAEGMELVRNRLDELERGNPRVTPDIYQQQMMAQQHDHFTRRIDELAGVVSILCERVPGEETGSETGSEPTGQPDSA